MVQFSRGEERMAADNYDLQVDIAKEIFLKYDQEQIIRKFCMDADERYLYLTYLNTPCRIDRQTAALEELICGKWKECREYATVMTVYDLLCHHKGDQLPALTGQWCTVGNFVVTGVTETDTFTKKYAHLFDGRLDNLKLSCEKLGAQLQPSMAGADLTCRIPVTSFFQVLLQFWSGDEEFPAKLMLLWDKNAMQFIHFETTFYLQGDLLSRVLQNMEEKI